MVFVQRLNILQCSMSLKSLFSGTMLNPSHVKDPVRLHDVPVRTVKVIGMLLGSNYLYIVVTSLVKK